MFNVYIAPVPSHIVGICGWPLALRPGGHLARRMHPHSYRGSRDSMPVVAQRSDGSGLQGELLTHAGSCTATGIRHRVTLQLRTVADLMQCLMASSFKPHPARVEK